MIRSTRFFLLCFVAFCILFFTIQYWYLQSAQKEPHSVAKCLHDARQDLLESRIECNKKAPSYNFSKILADDTRYASNPHNWQICYNHSETLIANARYRYKTDPKRRTELGVVIWLCGQNSFFNNLRKSVDRFTIFVNERWRLPLKIFHQHLTPEMMEEIVLVANNLTTTEPPVEVTFELFQLEFPSRSAHAFLNYPSSDSDILKNPETFPEHYMNNMEYRHMNRFMTICKEKLQFHK